MKTFISTLLFVVLGISGAFACSKDFPQGVHGRNIKVYVNTFTTTYDSKVNGSEDGRAYMEKVLVDALNDLEKHSKSPDTFVEGATVPDSNLQVNVVTDYVDATQRFQTTIRVFGYGKKGTLFTVVGEQQKTATRAILQAYFDLYGYLYYGWNCQ